MSETNTESIPVEKPHNQEREGVVRVLHLFYQERRQNTPTHRRYAELDAKENKTDEEKKERKSLKKKISEEKNDISRQLLLHSDSYFYLLNEGIFTDHRDIHEIDFPAFISFNRKIQFPSGYKEDKLFCDADHIDFFILLDELKKKYNISNKEWEKMQEIEWGEDEKKKLILLQKSAEGYKNEWKEQQVELQGHSFSEAVSATIKSCLLQGFLTAQYNKLALPKVHEGRVIADMMTGQFRLQNSE